MKVRERKQVKVSKEDLDSGLERGGKFLEGLEGLRG